MRPHPVLFREKTLCFFSLCFIDKSMFFTHSSCDPKESEFKSLKPRNYFPERFIFGLLIFECFGFCCGLVLLLVTLVKYFW